MRELNAQEELVDIAFANTKLPKNSQGLKVYKSLVYNRFFEVLSNGFPLFYSQIDKKRFESIVYEFMQHGAKSTVVWKMPNEFRKFVKKSKLLKDLPYVNDLLWFEWIEVSMMMQNYELVKQKDFSYKSDYRLNESVVLKKLKYKVFEEESYMLKGEYHLLAYYDFDEYEVYFREISLSLYLFLKELDKNGMKKAISKVAKMSEQNQKDVKEFFESTLEELVSLNVIRRI